MKLLLDTHILIWSLGPDHLLSKEAKDALRSPKNDVLVSVVSLWEITIKVRMKKLALDLHDVEREMIALRFGQLPITSRHLDTLAHMQTFHGDPFDHLLIAQAITENAVLVTQDRWIRRYPVEVL